MSQQKNKKLCIIGAGISGLTAGVLLIKQGYNVTIYEKEQYIGGRALSFDASQLSLDEYRDLLARFHMHIPFSEPDLPAIFAKHLLDGFHLDLGYHAIGGGVLSNLNNVLEQIDDHVDILESRVGLIKEQGNDFPFLSKVDMIKIAPYILRLLFASEKTLKHLDDISMTETIQRYGKGKMKAILEVFSRSITTVNNLDRISTGEMFRAQRNLYKGSKPVGYPKQGLVAIHEKLSRYILNHGGKINLQTPVDSITIQQNKATGVIVNGKKIPYDIIISSILIQELFKLADEKQFPQTYVSHIKSLTGTGSLCAYYSLKKVDSKLIGKTFHFLEKNTGVDGNDAVGMIDFMAASSESGMAPANQHVVQSYIICTPSEAKNQKILQKLRELLDTNLKRLIPDYQTQLNWAIYPAIWHLDGVAKTIDNIKPEITTPITNLYIIGDSVKAPGIGFNCALNSARKLSALLTQDDGN
jgi:protoporphyrinogen oxidase